MTKRRRDNDRKPQPGSNPSAERPEPAGSGQQSLSQRIGRFVPWVILGLCVLFLAAKAVPPSDPPGGMNVHRFGKLPVVYQGRIKPFDTLARNSLMIVSDRQTFVDGSGREQPAIKWLLDVLADRRAAMQHKVFRIENKQVLDTLGLEERQEPRFRYALAEFTSEQNLRTIDRQARQAQQKDAGQRDVYDTKILELRRQMDLFNRLASSHEIIDISRLDTREKLTGLLQRYRQLMRMNLPHAVPPIDPGNKEDWQPLMIARLQDVAHIAQDRDDRRNKATGYLSRILDGYRRGDTETFNSEVAAYRQWLNDRMPETMQASRVETFFHHFSPFLQSAALYVMVFVLGCLGLLASSGMLNPQPGIRAPGAPRPQLGLADALLRSAFWVAVLALAVHTAALIVRMWLEGRPPVTNLYSSAVFIGWGAVVFGLIVEMIYRVGLGSIVAAIVGFCTLLVAYNLSGDGDTMEMMQAVLDTNFWLATHVTVITLGYSATFLAGILGIIFIVMGVFTRHLSPEWVRELGRMIYGIICFALLLSFTGTVLGGLWADQSWGRFWGWDPKENGALIIVLWNALILHARWGGMIQQRGMATLAVFGNVVTAWSWFGVNMLGVGLHSYGFMDSAVFWLMLFVATQLIFIAMGSLPLGMWRSFNISGRGRARPGLQTRVKPEAGLAK